MKILAYVEENPLVAMAALAALFVAAVLLRLLTPAAFIAMLFGGIIMWCYGRSPPRPVEPEEAAAEP